MFSMRRSMILDGVQSSAISLYGTASVGSLFGFNSLMTLPIFAVVDGLVLESLR